ARFACRPSLSRIPRRREEGNTTPPPTAFLMGYAWGKGRSNRMAAYVPSGKVTTGGIVGLLARGLILGAALAVLVHFVGRLIYLLLIFPAGWGLVLGAALAQGVRSGKCRNVSLAFLVGLL